MGETITIIERRMNDGTYILESVCRDEPEAHGLVENADRPDGGRALGTLITIYCVDREDVPESNIFSFGDCAVPADTFSRNQLLEALRGRI